MTKCIAKHNTRERLYHYDYFKYFRQCTGNVLMERKKRKNYEEDSKSNHLFFSISVR